MMMVRSPLRWLASALCMICLSIGGAWAQTVSVQSGEHDGFTRLVLDIGANRDWDLSGDDARRQLALDPPVDGFDIARVFDLVPRSRLAALEAGELLTLVLACRCSVTATRYQGRYLVLDISDAAPTATASAPTTPAPSEALDVVRRQAAAERLPDTTRLLREDALPETPVPPAAPTSLVPDQIDIAEAARIMAEQLARAAASGLLEAAPGRPLSDADPLASADVADPSPTAVPEIRADAADLATLVGVPISAETALDVAQHSENRAEPQENRLICTGDELAMRDWSVGAGVQQGLGVLRQALLDDRDSLQRNAVLALARHYLAYGFGAEAAFWLSQIDHPPQELLVIAALVDGIDGARFPDEPDPLTCSDEELLWRYLDGALGAHPLTAERAGRLQRATAGLPPILRDQIAPRIARQLQADGFPNEARNLRDMVLRGGRVPEASMLYLDLDLGIAPADATATRDALALGLRDDGGDPVAAMAHALAFDRDTNTPVSSERLSVAEALLREFGLGARTAALWQEVTRAVAARGDLDRMLVLIDAGDTVPAPQRDATISALFADRLVAEDTTALFVLARVHGASWQGEGSAAGRARVGTIAHLRASGLTAAAEILRAGQRALILPARPGSAPEPADALRDIWQNGNWAEIAVVLSGPHQTVAERMALRRDLPAPIQASEGPDLNDIATRVADSRALRGELTALLNTPTPQVVEREQ